MKLLRGNISVLAAYPEAFANPLAPTSTELNALFAYSTNEKGMVFDISSAILDNGFTANVVASDTNDTRTVTDIGQVSNPTFTKYEVSFDFLRDASVTANGTFNLAFELFKAVDRPYFIAVRIGQPQGSVAAIGNDWSVYGVSTDNPVDVVGDGNLLAFGARFKNTGQVVPNFRLTV